MVAEKLTADRRLFFLPTVLRKQIQVLFFIIRSPQLRQLYNYFLYQMKYPQLLLKNITPSLYLQPVLELSNKWGKPKSERDFTARSHSDRYFSAQPKYQHPQINKHRYVFIASTFPKYLHLMKFHF